MSNYIALLVLTPLILASSLIKSKKVFVGVNLTCIIILVFYYSVMIYVEYHYTVESLYIHTTENIGQVVQLMIEGAKLKFNNIIYHLSAMTALLLINTAIFARKLMKTELSNQG